MANPFSGLDWSPLWSWLPAPFPSLISAVVAFLLVVVIFRLISKFFVV